MSLNLVLGIFTIKMQYELSALPKNTTCDLASLSPHYLFNAERQSRKVVNINFLNIFF